MKLWKRLLSRLFSVANPPAVPVRRTEMACEALEPRVLFSGAPVDGQEEVEAAAPADTQTAENPIQQGAIADQTGSDQNPAVPADSPVDLVSLNEETVRAIADAAAQRWAQSGLTDAQLAALNGITYQIGDLAGSSLGRADGMTITIDRDAAGSSAWFIDATPLADEEFGANGAALAGTGADSGYDLLTLVLHEQGHILGLDDLEGSGGLMDGRFTVAQRRLPAAGAADGATAAPANEEYANGTVTFYVNDATSFNAAVTSFVFKGIEDFESSTLAPNNVNHVNDPLAPGVANGWFPNGTNPAIGLTVQSNTLGGNATVTSPRGTNAIATASAGYFGTPTDQVSTQHQDDSFDMLFNVPGGDQAKAVSFIPLFFDTGTGTIINTNLTVKVYDTSNALIGTTNIFGGDYVNANSFLGVIADGNTRIGRINIFDNNPTTNDQSGADNIRVYTAAASSPEITVRFQTSNAEIVDGDVTPSGVGSEGTDFGSVDTATGNVTRTFVIRNDGTGALTLTGQPTLSSGSHFSISAISGGNLTLGANETRTFTVSFNPGSDGAKNDTVTILSNDADEATYDFLVAGTGTSPQTDLSITKTSADESVEQGGAVAYTITVTNNGPSAVTGARVTDAFSDLLTGITWTAVYSNGSGAAGGAGDIDELIDLGIGGTATYTVTGTVVAAGTANLAAQSIVTNTARLTAPLGTTDTNTANNADTDSDIVILAATGGTGTFSDSGQTLGSHDTQSVALGDVDGDGDLDLVEGNFDGTRVWLNDGSGNFSESGQLLGHNTTSVALGDVDGDGDLDFVAGRFFANTLVWLNNGSGSFTDSGQALGNHLTTSVALGDVDGDGDLDFVQGNYNEANRVWLNNGSGSFSDSGQMLGNHRTYSVALGDVDGDGDLDFVEGTNAANRVWLNDGSGGFSDSGQSLGNQFTFSVVLGDVDGDGDLDMIEGNEEQGNRVLLNNGSGIFTDSGQTLSNGYTHSVALGDVDGDGDLDLIEGREDDSETSEIESSRMWLNNGSGTFTDSGQALGDHRTLRVALGDLDGDGDLDFVQGNVFEANRVWLNQNVPQVDLTIVKTSPAEQVVQGGAVTYTITVANAGPDTATDARVTDAFSDLLGNVTWSAVLSGGATGDTSGAGDIDELVDLPSGASVVYTVTATVDAAGTAHLAAQSIVTNTATVEAPLGTTDTNTANNADTDSDIVILSATGGTGTFSDSGQTLGNHGTFSVVLGDVDGDGDLDMVEGNQSQSNRVWLNNGSGSFTDSGQSLGNHRTYSVALGDVDGDGDLDMVEGNTAQANRVWLNNGSGTFTNSGQLLGNHQSFSVVLGDVDGDGDLDLVEGNENQANRVWLNNGSGSFTDSGQLLGNHHTHSVALGDVDGDGDLDLVEGNSQNQANRVWLNNGSGSFTDSGQLLGNQDTRSVALGDVDGDGDLDLIEGNANQANRVWLNNGSGSFTDSGQTLGNHQTYSVALGDMDGDGDLDIVQGNSNQATRVWLNNGSGTFTDSGQTLGNHETYSVALGDVDGDGDLDIVEGNFYQANRVWLNENATNTPPPPNSAFVGGNGTLVVTGDGDGDTVTIKIVGGNVVVSTPDDSILGGNGTNTAGNGDVLIPLAGLNGIILNTGDGDDVITIGPLGNLTGNLSIDGGDGLDEIKLSGNTSVSGNATIEGEEVYLNKGNLTVGGDLSISGTDNGDGATDGESPGLDIRGFNLTAAGNITLIGSGGNGTGSTVGGNAGIELSYGSTVTAGGDLTVIGTGGNTPEGTNHGVVLYSGASLNSTGGNVTITGTAGTGGINNNGVMFNSASGATVVNGNLTIDGTGSLGGGYSDGVEVATGTFLTATGTGSILVNGTGGGVAGQSNSKGIWLSGATVSTTTGGIVLFGISGVGLSTNVGLDIASSTVTTGGGSIDLDGTSLGGAGGGSQNIGVRFNSSTANVTSGNGTLSIDGTGGDAGGNTQNTGVQMSGSTARTADGDLSIGGTGGGSGSGNRGVQIQSTTIEVTGNGTLSIVGNGTVSSTTGSSNDGVYVATGGVVQTLGTGNLSVTGNGGTGTTTNHGIRIASGQVRAIGGGTVTLTGIANGNTSGNSNVGVSITGATSAVTGAAGSLISGTGGGLTSGLGTLNHGVHIDASITLIVPDGEVTGTAGFGATSKARNGKYTP